MKFALISCVLLSANAMACPDGASSKDAMAPAMSKPAVAAKVTPTSLASTTALSTSAKAPQKVATKANAEPRKTAPL